MDGDEELAAVMSERRQLLNVAYRLLGSLADAEDVVQETYARWYGLAERERAAVAAPGAWLTTVAGRICLDQLRSARARRERYVGEWLPEPVPGDAGWFGGEADPADRVTLDESVSMAFLVVLDAMTPAERVAFVLHDVFRYSFAEVAAIVGRTPAACRQLAFSARRRLQREVAPPPPADRRAGLVREFKRAWEARDIDALLGLLDPAASLVADGGGRAEAILQPVEGGGVIAEGVVRIAGLTPDMVLLEQLVNGQPGLVAQVDGVTVTVFSFGFTGDRISHIWAMRNPDKLGPWLEAPTP
ncbi:RNA polymerase sigma factor SigJ [Dactylosporangium salmoneum]|uniref:RNA polymerase sigma factor SigJ n=1 Tax=Dactylosporangium salmoneum TaxID=53361 RepID=A0ABN3GTL4_9ACTN